MRNSPNMRVERHRIRGGLLGSSSQDGNNGVFIIPYGKLTLSVVCSDEEGWDHVSVSVDINPPRLPTWEEMCYVKDLFFRDEETVVQFHPKRSAYRNVNPWVLHLWRDQSIEYSLPPGKFIGPQSLSLPPGEY